MDRTQSTSAPPVDATRADSLRCWDCGRQLPRWREGPVFCRCWRCEWFHLRFGGQADSIHAHGMGVRWE